MATNSYDAAGQMLQLKDIDAGSNIILQYDYTYNAAGNLISEKTAIAAQPLNILGISIIYGSDNRPTVYNGSNQVSHDADGNMTVGPLYQSGFISANFTYDARNRLTAVDTTAYLYDAENNRIRVKKTAASTIT